MTEKYSFRLFFVLVTLLLFVGGTLAVTPRVSFGSSSINSPQLSLNGASGVIVPLYSYPGWAWSQLAADKAAYPSVPIVAIINPSNGPGSYQDSNFLWGVRMLQSAGIAVIGYVPTSYTWNPLSTAEWDAQQYMNLYGVNGFFFDEMTNVPGYEWYYSALNNFAHSIGSSLNVGNPGAPVPSSYVGTMDNIVIYENSGLPSSNTVSSSTFWGSYGKSAFSYICYGASWIDQSYISSVFPYVSYMYATDGNMPAPYQTLPSYMTTLLSDLSSLDGSYASVPISVSSADLNGNAIPGLWSVVTSNWQTVQTGFTPMSFSSTVGTTYQITVSNYGKYVFSHWSDGTTSNTITVTSSGSPLNLVAYYSTGQSQVSINVASVDPWGDQLYGLYAQIYQGNSLVGSGFTPVTFTVTAGVTYSVVMSDYSNYVFNHWQDWTMSRTYWITPGQNSWLTAYYTT